MYIRFVLHNDEEEMVQFVKKPKFHGLNSVRVWVSLVWINSLVLFGFIVWAPQFRLSSLKSQFEHLHELGHSLKGLNSLITFGSVLVQQYDLV
jgi:hypothetical protein